jgi:hypothetical protein
MQRFDRNPPRILEYTHERGNIEEIAIKVLHYDEI